MNVLREKLKSKEILIGTQTFLGDKYVAGILGAMDYDFVFMCAEHTVYGIEKISDMVKYCEASGTPALVRLPEYDKTFTKKIIDSGVSSVLFPMIKSANEANEAMDVCLYPPYGKRGFGPMGAVNFGVKSEKEFVDTALDGMVRMIQIEHIDAIKNLEEIVQNKYIDAYVFGPNDLASSMGHILDVYNPQVQAVIQEATYILKQANKRFGVSLVNANEEQIQYWKSLGMTIFSLGADTAFVREGATKVYERFKSLL